MAAQSSRRNWLEGELRAEPTLAIAGIAETFPRLRSLLYDVIIDAVVIDAPFSFNSERVREWLAELLNAVPLVMLCAAEDRWLFEQMAGAGSGALLSREASARQIVHAILGAAAGLLVFDPALIPHPAGADDVVADLTPREIQVLRLLAEGLVNREIAERLGISEHTIKFHIGSILGKLQASSRTEAVTRGLRAGLIEL